jgi:RHS repeat-associated protein
VRKVTELQNGKRKDERIYLGGFEVFRRYNGDGQAVTLARETLHVMDNKQRVALIETKTLDVASPFTPHPSLVRYQLGNHLGSAALELDDQAQVISYEEYHPYGTAAYEAARSNTETAKRYRYTGKERDEETEFTYHGARYYSPWLGRWASCDPSGLSGGINQYVYANSDPIGFVDLGGMQPGSPNDSPKPPQSRPRRESIPRRSSPKVSSVPLGKRHWRDATTEEHPHEIRRYIYKSLQKRLIKRPLVRVNTRTRNKYLEMS